MRIILLFLKSYTLLYGKAPFETNDVQSTYKKIKKMSFAFPVFQLI